MKLQMDTLLKETVNAAVNSRYPAMNFEGRKLIEEILVRKDFEKGEILLSEGQVSHDIMIVGKGMVRQFYYKNGKDVTEHFSYEGCIYRYVYRKSVEAGAYPFDDRGAGRRYCLSFESQEVEFVGRDFMGG